MQQNDKSNAKTQIEQSLPHAPAPELVKSGSPAPLPARRPTQTGATQKLLPASRQPRAAQGHPKLEVTVLGDPAVDVAPTRHDDATEAIRAINVPIGPALDTLIRAAQKVGFEIDTSFEYTLRSEAPKPSGPLEEPGRRRGTRLIYAPRGRVDADAALARFHADATELVARIEEACARIETGIHDDVVVVIDTTGVEIVEDEGARGGAPSARLAGKTGVNGNANGSGAGADGGWLS